MLLFGGDVKGDVVTLRPRFDVFLDKILVISPRPIRFCVDLNNIADSDMFVHAFIHAFLTVIVL